MSVQVNHYVAHGIMLPYKEAHKTMLTYGGFEDEDDVYDFYEPYTDSAFEGIKHHNGLCVLSDGMNGKYFFVGRILAKTDNYDGFDEPMEIPTLDKAGDDVLQELIKAKFGLEGEIKSYVISHYR